MNKQLDVTKFEPKFHESWWPKMKEFFEGEDAYKIYQYLKLRSNKGIDILPVPADTFKAFSKCRFNDLSVVIVGMEPYSTLKNNKVIADGLAFSNSYTGDIEVQPSLTYLWHGIKNDLKLEKLRYSTNLDFLSEQGVLLLNSSLTVEKMRIESHLKLSRDVFPTSNLWDYFQKHLFQNVLYGTTGIVYILMGAYAKKLKKYINPLGNYILETDHPSFAARNKNEDWMVDNVFSKTAKILKANNNIEIYWDYDEFLDKSLPF